MSKATYLDDLNQAHRVEHLARQSRCKGQYKNMPKQRWLEVCAAHNRRVLRQARRSVGRGNKVGVRRTAKGMRDFLGELNMLAQICRRNRRYVMGNSGSPAFYSESLIRKEIA